MKLYFVPLLLLFGAPTSWAQSDQAVDGAPATRSSIGYASVHEALASLKAKPGANISVTKPDGWIIVNESSPAFAIWSFTPEGHYAYPAVVRRTLGQSNGRVQVMTAALCEAAKQPCDRLIQEFEQLNEKMRSQFRPPAQPESSAK